MGGNFIVAASASSGAAVVLSRGSGPCLQVSADAAALIDYLAGSKNQTVSIEKASPQISFDSGPSVVLSA